MGWDFQHRERNVKTADLLMHDLGDGRQGGRGIIAWQSVGTTVYIAYRTSQGNITAVVALTKTVKDSWYNWGVKYLDEGTGPCEKECPARILDLLSPLEQFENTGDYIGTHAADWRAACRAACEKSTKLEPGAVIHFAEGLPYNGEKVYDILVVHPGRRIGRAYYRDLDLPAEWPTVAKNNCRVSKGLVRIPKWWGQCGAANEVIPLADLPAWLMELPAWV